MLAGPLSLFEALVLGIVEGITEFLPVSSTGHLLVVQSLLGIDTGESAAAADTFTVAIQLGAILAVLGLYRRRAARIAAGLVGRDPVGAAIGVRLAVAFLPAAVLGAAFGDRIKEVLFGPLPVAAAWAAGGLLLLAWAPGGGTRTIESLPLASVAAIGVAQTLALWPGVSRSLVTLLAALAVGMSMAAALEFSFLLGLVTLAAASLYELVRNGDELVRQFGIVTPLFGAAVGLVTAAVSVRWLTGFVSRRGLRPFGWYRLGAATVAVCLVAAGAF